MKAKPKPVRYRRQCAKCRQKGPKTGYPELLLTDTTGNCVTRATLCPACLQRFWWLYAAFVQSRSRVKPVYVPPPTGFRAAIPYRLMTHQTVIEELKRQIRWHQEGIRYLEKMPKQLSAPHPKP